MSNPPTAGAPIPPPPPGPGVGPGIYGSRERPWWSAIDVPFAVVWFVFALFISGIVSLIVIGIGEGNLDNLDDTPVYAAFFAQLVFQVLQGLYPWLVSKWKGLGIEEDWRFTSNLPDDIAWGFSLAVACAIGAQVVTVLAALAVGLDDSSDASNTAILSDNRSSPWIFGLIFLVVVGAPLVEELLFRGLILRAFQKSFGNTYAIIGSSLLFTLPHWQPDATWQETVVLLSALFTVGFILAIGAVRLNRLGPTVIAHFFFNAFGTFTVFLLN